MKPSEVTSENEQRLLDTVYNYETLITPSNGLISSRTKKILRRRSANFKVGDKVRISKYRSLFDKGYTPNWTTELFTIKKVNYHTDPITYLLIDYKNQEIKGVFYTEELQLAKKPNIFLVEKVLDTRKGQVYVKWLGLGPEHNLWISKKNLI